MPNVNPAGSSAPPMSGSVEDPQLLSQAETVSYNRAFPVDAHDPGLPEQEGVLDCLELVRVNHSPEQLNAGEEKSSGDDMQACGHLRKREKVIKEISISSTAFIGPACRPEPVIENELSEFYKELSQFDKPDNVDGKSESVPQSCAPPDSVDGRNECVSQSCDPPDMVYQNSERVSQSWAPSLISPAIKEKGNDHRSTYRPYPATRPQPDYRNTPQWSPHWSYPRLNQNQKQLPPPNFHFYPPPQAVNPAPPPFSQPLGQQCHQIENNGFRLVPDVRLGSSPSSSPASYAPREAFERRQYDEQNYQDINQHEQNNGPSLVMILMRGVPGSGKSTLARQISSYGPSGLILSTDDYFYHEDGYHFDPTLLGAAHDWNQNRAKNAMWDRRTPVIIDNTNVQAWEMKPYVMAALEMGYRVRFVEPETSWKFDPVELEKRNHHGVPKESIANMLERFELPISVDIVMNSCEPFHKRKEHHSRPHRHRR